MFVDNLDADSYTRLLEADLRKTKFFVVSKSGNTAETMMQLGGALLALERDGLAVAKHIGGIAGAQDNALATAGTRIMVSRCWRMKRRLAGGFPVLTNVGLVPAIWAGLDPLDVRRGAARVLDNFADADFAPLHGAALNLAHMRAGRNIAVLMPYADRLDRLTFWYRQLWAESLGKQGHGSVPTNAWGRSTSTARCSFIWMGRTINFIRSSPMRRAATARVCRQILPTYALAAGRS